MYVCLSEKELCKTFFSSLNIVQGRQVGNQGISDLLERGVRGFGYADIVNSKVNRCLAQYSLRATTTNQPTNRAPNEPARLGKNANFGPNVVVLGQKVPIFTGER